MSNTSLLISCLSIYYLFPLPPALPLVVAFASDPLLSLLPDVCFLVCSLPCLLPPFFSSFLLCFRLVLPCLLLCFLASNVCVLFYDVTCHFLIEAMWISNQQDWVCRLRHHSNRKLPAESKYSWCFLDKFTRVSLERVEGWHHFLNGKLTEEEAVEFVNMLPRQLTFTASFDADASDEQQTKPRSTTNQQQIKSIGRRLERLHSLWQKHRADITG